MSSPHPMTEPFADGMLEVGDGHVVHWQLSGNPEGKPAVLLHGGPGSGASPRHRGQFDPRKYLLIQFDQRGSGRSTPSAGEPSADLTANTTRHLIADIELLRQHLAIDRWLVWGASWGTTLGLAYAETHPARVSELLLGAVVMTSHADVEWITRGMGRFFPERWRHFRDFLPPESRHGNLAAAYNQLLLDPDPAVHHPAAIAWCEWEDTHVSLLGGDDPYLRSQDARFRLCFARLVTHYFANAGFLADGALLDGTVQLDGIPTFLAHGRRDVSSPVDHAVELAARINGSELFIAESEGHSGPEISAWLAHVSDRLASD